MAGLWLDMMRPASAAPFDSRSTTVPASRFGGGQHAKLVVLDQKVAAVGYATATPDIGLNQRA